jgi:hypothetical protein
VVGVNAKDQELFIEKFFIKYFLWLTRYRIQDKFSLGAGSELDRVRVIPDIEK